MRKLKYHLLDVFTNRAFGGNQLAVFTNARGLPTSLMQTIAKEFNLSETTFVFPAESPENDYKLRIFTPGAEVPMAGHPTVGTTYVLALKKMLEFKAPLSTFRLEENVGVIPVSLQGSGAQPDYIVMTQPLPTFEPEFTGRDLVAGLLSISTADLAEGLPLQVVTCGVPFLYVPLKNLEVAGRVKLRLDIWEKEFKGTNAAHIFVFTTQVENEGSTVHSRMFAPAMGITEDPATGAASGPLGSYLVRHKVVPEADPAKIVSEQGLEMGRPSFINIEIDCEDGEISGVRISGQCFYMGEGYLEVDTATWQ
jgi:trans-2,3-dihydro-3-hydroxyanthranilate isomerase